jgi:multiple sugar transport system ATP-binding protein
MSRILIDHVTKIYPGDVKAADDVSLEIASGEFMVLVGPSGCGKSTLMRMVAGLEDVTEGAIYIGDEDVTDLSPRHRDIAMVFQNYALYPHMSVRRNLGYGLKVRKAPRAEVERRVGEVAKLLALEELLDRRPAALSGGQRQRVAMGRAIVREPAAFLMDEPLSNLDAKLRVSMRAELSRLHERLGVTTVYVTHDQVEAMTLGQRVAVMRDGRIQQVDVPQNLYKEPANLFVAAFIGSPSMNLDGELILGIRPESFEDARFADPALPQIDVEVQVVEELGPDAHVIFAINAPRVSAEDLEAVADEPLEGLIADDQRALFNARVDPRTNAGTGRAITLAVDAAHFHFFDPETGETLRAEGALAHAGR